MMKQLLIHEDVVARLGDVPAWHHRGNAIERVFDGGDFFGAMRFANRVADAATAADHHPDILISYNRVTVTLTSHDAGGLTERDFALARTIDRFVDR
jgi:4a-hydroxytetrahydrobiopterin dehydratase